MSHVELSHCTLHYSASGTGAPVLSLPRREITPPSNFNHFRDNTRYRLTFCEKYSRSRLCWRMTPAVIEQIIYHGFITHLHLRLPNGDPLLAFLRPTAGSDRLPIGPGTRLIARWPDDAAHIVRDEINLAA